MGHDKTERIFPAEDQALGDVLGFAEGELEKAGCPMKTKMAVVLAVEEIFVNIAHYAYEGKKGEVKLSFRFSPDTRTAVFEFSDQGIPFDPLKIPDPDLTLDVEERQIGGLGIFITRKTMDDVLYRYENEENILSIVKKI